MSYNELRNVERSEETTASELWDGLPFSCGSARLVAPVDRRETYDNGSHVMPRRFLLLADDECFHLDASRSRPNAIVAFSYLEKSVRHRGPRHSHLVSSILPVP